MALETGFEVAAAAEQVVTEGKADFVRRVVAFIRYAALQVDLDAIKIRVGDEIGHAGDGVRAIDGGHTAGHDVHTLDQHLWQCVDVDIAVRRGGGDAVTLEQHQVTLRSHVAEVQ